MAQSSSRSDLPRLVRRSRGGDAAAWDALVERFASLVYSVARRVGLNSADSEDVSQVVFLKLYQNLDKIENPEALGGWLSVTAAREALRVKRIASRTINLDANAPTLEETLVDEESTADELASASESVDRIMAALAKLRDKCRELLSALYLEDDPSYSEISERLDIPIGSIGPTRARCIERLRSSLGKLGYFDDGVSRRSGRDSSIGEP